MTRPHFFSAARRGARRAYTVIEVLMAMTVMAIGGAAVITMQKTSVTGNLDARRADVANAIARTWVERLHRESMQWTLPGRENPTGNNLANAPVLANVVAAPGIWFLPVQDMGKSGAFETMSPAFDILGRDLPQASMNTADFCVHVRLSWLGTTLTPPGGDLMRADVRVLWPMGILNSLPGFCNAASAALLDPNGDPAILRTAGADPNEPAFHAIYVTTSVRENASP
jgi:prepilin-type N-terminal cleavage/methylation domain-containing protein